MAAFWKYGCRLWPIADRFKINFTGKISSINRSFFPSNARTQQVCAAIAIAAMAMKKGFEVGDIRCQYCKCYNFSEAAMTALKLTQIGNSVGVILPKESLARLKLAKGDTSRSNKELLTAR